MNEVRLSGRVKGFYPPKTDKAPLNLFIECSNDGDEKASIIKISIWSKSEKDKLADLKAEERIEVIGSLVNRKVSATEKIPEYWTMEVRVKSVTIITEPKRTYIKPVQSPQPQPEEDYSDSDLPF